MELIEFQTADKLVNYLQDKFRTKDRFQMLNFGQGGYIFRGQANAEWEIKSTVFRSPLSLYEFAPQLLHVFPDVETPLHKIEWLAYHSIAEVRATRIFLEEADRAGIPTAIDYFNLNLHLDELVDAINYKKYDFNKPFPPNQMLEEFALAQHHGVPTRLIDWTESYLIACFFSAFPCLNWVNNLNNGFVMNELHEKISIICFETKFVHESPNITIVRAPQHRNSFLRIQQGIFTNLSNANSFYLEHNQWPTFEDFVSQTEKLKNSLIKCTLPKTEAINLLRILYDYGITLPKLMPTLDNIAKSYAYSSSLFGKY